MRYNDVIERCIYNHHLRLTTYFRAVDRSVFRSCIVDNMFQKRMQYEEFLKQVPLLEGLTPAEVSKVRDAC